MSKSGLESLHPSHSSILLTYRYVYCSIGGDYRQTVYNSAVRVGTLEDWDHAHEAYILTVDSDHSNKVSEKNRLLEAMAHTVDLDVLQKLVK